MAEEEYTLPSCYNTEIYFLKILKKISNSHHAKVMRDMYDIAMFKVRDTDEEKALGQILYREEESVDPTSEYNLYVRSYLLEDIHTTFGLSIVEYMQLTKYELDMLRKELNLYEAKKNEGLEDYERKAKQGKH